MKRFINFGSIDQFRTVAKNIKWDAQYKGKDAEGNPIIDRTAAPTLTAYASEKIHGTNAAVCYSNTEGFWVQSRKNIITPEKDNAACAFQAMQNEASWMDIVHKLATTHSVNLDTHIISIFYEWAGGNIQKNSCVSGSDKAAYIFRHFKVSPLVPQLAEDATEVAIWLETISDSTWVTAQSIYNVMNFPTVQLEIDFERTDLAQNTMIELTESVESASGIAKSLNLPADNIGEGWVWTLQGTSGNIQRWKTKGDKHSASKVKTLAPVDSVKEQAKVDFVNNHATKPFRLEQAWQECFGIADEKLDPTITSMGNFLRLVINDVLKEESDIMQAANLEPKECNQLISKVARQWFQTKLNS